MASLTEFINELKIEQKDKQQLTSFVSHLNLRTDRKSNKVLFLRGIYDRTIDLLGKICKEHKADDYCYIEFDKLMKELKILKDITSHKEDHPTCIFGNLSAISSICRPATGKKFCIVKDCENISFFNDSMTFSSAIDELLNYYTNVIFVTNNIDKLYGGNPDKDIDIVLPA